MVPEKGRNECKVMCREFDDGMDSEGRVVDGRVAYYSDETCWRRPFSASRFS